MPRPASESALVAEKKPPMLQPKARTPPTPSRSPPQPPFRSSPRGGTRTANSLARSAPPRPPRRTPAVSSDPEETHGARRSPRRPTARPPTEPGSVASGSVGAQGGTVLIAFPSFTTGSGQSRPRQSRVVRSGGGGGGGSRVVRPATG